MSAGRKRISEKKDWNTPPKYIKAVYDFFGEVDLDPCSNELSIVNAKTEFILPIDGLKEEWDYKRIFMNPPYGRDMAMKTTIKNWIIKANEAYINGSEVLALIPVATSSSHFKEIIFKEANSICFLGDTRLKFMVDGELSKMGAPMSCCIVYWGKDYDKFENIFSEYGKCVKI